MQPLMACMCAGIYLFRVLIKSHSSELARICCYLCWQHQLYFVLLSFKLEHKIVGTECGPEDVVLFQLF